MLRIGICDENTKDRTVIRQIVTDNIVPGRRIKLY